MTHIIRQQYLHVELNGTESDGLALQRSLPDFCRDWLTPAIERALERCAPPIGHLCIERLELDIGTLRLESLQRDLAEAVEQALEKWLREHAPPAGYSPSTVSGPIRHKAAHHSINQALIHFLQTGSLPWSFRLPHGKSLEEVILKSWLEAEQSGLESGAGEAELLQALAGAPARKRLVLQFSRLFVKTMLTRLWPESKKDADGIMVEGIFDLQGLWETKFAHVARSSPAAQTPHKAVQTMSSGSRRPECAETEEGIFIENAGIVLLHPFLPRFFQSLNIADQDKLLQPERALCLLHYLAAGQAVAPEYELMLPKILCNIPLPTPVATILELSAAEIEEACALLEAVIRHWDALRNTSPDGLRGTFLLRPGKLSWREDGDCVLQVEARTCDVLLGQLPWGIGAIKLPWMEKMLWVEWA